MPVMKSTSPRKKGEVIKISSVAKSLYPVGDPSDCHIGQIKRVGDDCFRLVEVKQESVNGVMLNVVYGKTVTVK